MIPGRISVVMPTTGRKDRAVACIEQIFRTTVGRDVEVICVVDVDWDTATTLSNIPHVHVWWFDHYQSIAQCLNIGLKNAQGEYIVLLGDDTRPEGNWLEESLRVMGTLPEGVGLVGFNDGHMDGKIIATHYIAHRKFIMDYMGGVIGFECYGYACNDAEATERAKRAGRYAYAENARVWHDHPAHGTRPDDDNDLRHRPLADGDNKTFERRQAANFPDDFERVISS